MSLNDIFPETVPTGYYLVFAALLFCIGLFITLAYLLY